MPPSTAWAGMPAKASAARGSSRRCRYAANSVATAIAPSTNVSWRLVNSMTPWNELAFVGLSDEPVHCGQVGQPSPEPVSRTAPPVTTITTLATTDASASSRSTRGDANHARTRCRSPAGTTELTPTGTTARQPATQPRPRSAT
jgi:hypothetical protein